MELLSNVSRSIHLNNNNNNPDLDEPEKLLLSVDILCVFVDVLTGLLWQPSTDASNLQISKYVSWLSLLISGLILTGNLLYSL